MPPDGFTCMNATVEIPSGTVSLSQKGAREEEEFDPE
jgi:hypothetical protein